jgi:hypothetical protein
MSVRWLNTVGFYTFLASALSVWTPPALTAQAGSVQVSRVAGPPDVEALGQRPLAGHPPTLAELVRVTGFIQQNPSDGTPATQRTEVYLGYDDRALYAVFVATDSEPDRIRARMASRENLGADDFVTLILDTDHDSRRAYAFRSNPRGVQWDALWTEGQGFDTSFDAVWGSRGRLTPTGYVVSFEIPFKSLRFPTTGSQTWGIVLSRNIPRDQGEVSYWPWVSSEIQGTLTQSAVLRGLENISPGRNIQVIPYTNARSFRALDHRAEGGPRFVSDDADFDFGADFKAVLDDRFVVDLTANPDFSQVESDQPQVTVNQRFEVFFPERRPFFTENADYFRTPISVLFTRRIADPQFGSRFTGKAGAWGIGGLVIDDQSPGKLTPVGSDLEGKRAWFTVGRVNRDIGDFSRVGAIYAGREFNGGYNRVAGADGRVRFDDHWSASGQFIGSRTREPGDDVVSGYAASASLSRSGRQFSYFGGYTDISPDFEARAGFIPRTDQRRMSHFASYFFRPERTLISWGPEVFIVRLWDHDGNLLDEITEASLEWNFVGSSNVEVNYRIATDRLRPEDHPSLPEIRDYDVGFWDIEYGTSYLDWVQLGGNLRFGNQINFNPVDGEEPAEADWLQLLFGLSFRPATQLRIDNTLLWTTLDDPLGGDRIFTDRILRTRWNWQFTRELSVRAILQYEHTTTDPLLTSLETRENLNADFLVTYRVNPWTAIYAGVNTNGQNVELIHMPGGERRLQRIDDLRNDAHQFFIKASYLLRF